MLIIYSLNVFAIDNFVLLVEWTAICILANNYNICLRYISYDIFFLLLETHDGVQDMACDTFIKIAMKCRRYFVQIQLGEAMPFIDEILNSMATIISDLQPQQVIYHRNLK